MAWIDGDAIEQLEDRRGGAFEDLCDLPVHRGTISAPLDVMGMARDRA